MWQVKFKDPITGEIHYCEKPFLTKSSAELFAKTIEVTSKYKAEVYREKKEVVHV